MNTILVIDDDQAVRRTLEIHLADEGYKVQTAGDGAEGLTLSDDADLVLLDLRLPGIDGFEVLTRLKAKRPEQPVVVITAYDDMNTAIEATRLGAVDHLGKPVDMEHLNQVIKSALIRSARTSDGLAFEVGNAKDLEERVIIGKSLAMKEVFKAVGRVVDSPATVLITGESGTGKELVARAIHFGGRFRDTPFVPVACSALSPTLLESELFGHEKGSFTGAVQRKIGKFELAASGTIFLDEISEITPDIQVKLLRFLQERRFERVGGVETVKADARVVAATNKDLSELVEAKLFRDDLFYRLNVVTIRLPPLRDRLEDIPLLVPYFLERIRIETGKAISVVTRPAMDAIMSHTWPGNVRELENALRRAALLSPGEVLDPDLLELQPKPLEKKLPLLVEPLAEIERMHIENILEHAGWEKKKAAALLDISRPTLDKKIADYGLKAADHKRREPSR